MLYPNPLNSDEGFIFKIQLLPCETTSGGLTKKMSAALCIILCINESNAALKSLLCATKVKFLSL